MTSEQLFKKMEDSGKWIWKAENKREDIRSSYNGEGVTEPETLKNESLRRLKDYLSYYPSLTFRVTCKKAPKEPESMSDVHIVEPEGYSNNQQSNNNNKNSDNGGSGFAGLPVSGLMGFYEKTYGDLAAIQIKSQNVQNEVQLQGLKLENEYNLKQLDLQRQLEKIAEREKKLDEKEAELKAQEKEIEKNIDSQVPAYTKALQGMFENILNIKPQAQPQAIAGAEAPLSEKEQIIVGIEQLLLEVEDIVSVQYLKNVGSLIKRMRDIDLDKPEVFTILDKTIHLIATKEKENGQQ